MNIVVTIFGLEVNVLAQVFGLIGLILMCISFFQNDKRGYAGVMMIAHIFFAAEALTVKGYSNVVTNSTGIVRNGTVYCSLVKRKKDPPKWSIWLFAVIAVSVAAFFIDDAWSALPVACFVLQCVYLASENFMFLKIGSLITESSMFFYNVFMGAYIGGVRQIIACTMLVLSIIKYKKTLKAKQGEEGHGTGTC